MIEVVKAPSGRNLNRQEAFYQDYVRKERKRSRDETDQLSHMMFYARCYTHLHILIPRLDLPTI